MLMTKDLALSDYDLERTNALRIFGKERFEFLFPDYLDAGAPVIPKETDLSFIDVPVVIMNDILAVARELYTSLSSKFAPDGISFIQCNGAFNDLKHFHLHIFPRHHGDGFGWTCSEIGLQSQDQLIEAARGL